MSRASGLAAAVLSVFVFSACSGGGTAPAPGGTGSGGTGADAGNGSGGGADAGNGGGSPDAGGTGGGARFTLAVVKSGSGHVVSSPTGIDCGTSCTALFDAGTAVSLLPTPGAGWTFAGWGGGCSGPGACIVTSNATVYATFQAVPPPPPLQKSVTVTVVALAGISGTVTSSPPGLSCPGTCTFDFEAAAPVTLTATPGAGALFSAWSGSCTGAGACTLSGPANASVTATFAAAGPPAECAGLAPDAEPMQEYVHAPFFGSCGPGQGDATGTLSFNLQFNDAARGDYGSRLEFVSTAGVFLQEQSTWEVLSPYQEVTGVAALGTAGHAPQGSLPAFRIFDWNHSGDPAVASDWRQAQSFAAASGGGGRLLIAGDVQDGTAPASGGPPVKAAPLVHSAFLFSVGGNRLSTLWGPRSLASPGAVFGAGIDAQGRSLVITDGSSAFGSGAISAQWLDVDGTPLTSQFLVVAAFVAGPSTWFETATLSGGGLAVRRRDATYPGGKLEMHSQWLVTVASGVPSVQPAPAWLTSRPDTRLQLTRGGRGYAILPDRQLNVACTQRVEVLATDGTACGSRDYEIASGTCDTLDLAEADEGTVIQPLPTSLETVDPVMGSRSCTWRYWAHALR